MKWLPLVLVAGLLLAVVPASAQPLYDEFWAQVDPEGTVVADSSGATGEWPEWEYYPSTGWWNVWFRDGEPIAANKWILLNVRIRRINPGLPAWFILYLNRSTPFWDATCNPFPPLPDYIPTYDEEMFYIQRDPLGFGVWNPPEGPHDYYEVTWDGWLDILIEQEIVIFGYNPKWISIDIMGSNVAIEGDITHECVTPVRAVTWGRLKALYR